MTYEEAKNLKRGEVVIYTGEDAFYKDAIECRIDYTGYPVIYNNKTRLYRATLMVCFIPKGSCIRSMCGDCDDDFKDILKKETIRDNKINELLY